MQCQKPTGWLGRFTLWQMNRGHSALTDWGLQHVTVAAEDVILDAGCGGGETIRKLAAMAPRGRVHGIDFSEESVAASTRRNAATIAAGQVEIRCASVDQLPFPDATFDLVTAVETHFWWPDIAAGLREILRVLKPGGRLIVIAEVYKGATSRTSRMAERFAARTGMALLSLDEHRRLLEGAGFAAVEIFEEKGKGWVCAVGARR